jgi:hypothetical protein
MVTFLFELTGLSIIFGLTSAIELTERAMGAKG